MRSKRGSARSGCRLSRPRVDTIGSRSLTFSSSTPVWPRTLGRLFRRGRASWSSTTTHPCWRRCARSEEHTSELQSQSNLVCRLLLEKKKNTKIYYYTKHIYAINASSNMHSTSIYDISTTYAMETYRLTHVSHIITV